METQIIEQAKQHFSDEWWNDFIASTDGFSRHALNKNIFSKQAVAKLEGLVEDIIKKVTKDKKRQSHLRIWKEGKIDRDPSKFFYDNPILQDEKISDWKSRVFGEEKFGLFFNHANNHSDELSDLLLKYVNPFFEQHGIPAGGISTTIILGDYGWTPLGIHTDQRGEYIVHFHLGPGEKDIYIWDEEKAKKYGYKPGKKVENREDYIKDYSYKGTFNTGDIFSMPGSCIHIGNSREFSIGLVLEFNGLTEKEFFQKLWFELGGKLFSNTFSGKEARILPSYQEDNQQDFTNYLLKGIKNTEANVRKDIKASLTQVAYELKHALASNQGFAKPPFVEEKNLTSFFEKIRSQSKVSLIRPYQILIGENMHEGFINVFVRGNKIKINSCQKVIDVINSLNEGQQLALLDIKSRYLEEWSDGAVEQLVYLLYKANGIKISF